MTPFITKGKRGCTCAQAGPRKSPGKHGHVWRNILGEEDVAAYEAEKAKAEKRKVAKEPEPAELPPKSPKPNAPPPVAPTSSPAESFKPSDGVDIVPPLELVPRIEEETGAQLKLEELQVKEVEKIDTSVDMIELLRCDPRHLFHFLTHLYILSALHSNPDSIYVVTACQSLLLS